MGSYHFEDHFEVTILGHAAGGFEEWRESSWGWRGEEGGLGAQAPSRKLLC